MSGWLGFKFEHVLSPRSPAESLARVRGRLVARAAAAFSQARGGNRLRTKSLKGGFAGRPVSVSDGRQPVLPTLYRTNRVRDRFLNFSPNLHSELHPLRPQQ